MSRRVAVLAGLMVFNVAGGMNCCSGEAPDASPTPAAPAISGAQSVTLVRNGVAHAIIVTPDRPSAAANSAASLLRDYLRRMTGAELEILKESAAPASATEDQPWILVGEGRRTADLGLSSQELGPGGVALHTRPHAVALFGPDERTPTDPHGSLHAAIEFLDRLGCRQLWPGELGTIVPKARTVSAPKFDVAYTPPIQQRKIRINAQGPRLFEEGVATLEIDGAAHLHTVNSALEGSKGANWQTWQRLGGDLGFKGGHAGSGLRGGWKKHGKAHPEWFAQQVDGTRDQSRAENRWQVCVSNPELIEHVANDIISQLPLRDGSPIPLCPNDGGYSNHCLCDECQKLDPPDGPKIRLQIFDRVGEPSRTEREYVSLTDRYLHYCNAVAERVVKTAPHQLFIVDAYSSYSEPPTRERVHPNFVVRYVSDDPRGWEGWKAAGATRLYWRPNLLHYGYIDGAPRVVTRQMADAISFIARRGALATDMDSIMCNWATQGLDYYAAAQLNWNPYLPFDAILDDYCRSGFGPASEHVKAYFLRVETITQGASPAARSVADDFPQEVVAELGNLLDAAHQAAAGDDEVERRVAFLRSGLDLTALSAQIYSSFAAKAQGKRVDRSAVHELMNQRWTFMRNNLRSFPLAINCPMIAAHDHRLNTAFAWQPPAAKPPSSHDDK